MIRKNYYQILGVKSTVGQQEIKEAYRKLSKKFTLMLTGAINILKNILRVFKKLMKYCPMTTHVEIMI